MWEPSREGLADLLELLERCTFPNTEVQRKVREQLDSYNETVEDYNNYLVYIFCSYREVNQPIRQLAGVFLKNNIKYHWEDITPQVLLHIQESLLENLGDPIRKIRTTISLVISTVLEKGSPVEWPGLFDFLCEALEKGDDNMRDGAMDCVAKICEDHGKDLLKQEYGYPLKVLLPKIIENMWNNVDEVRENAVASILFFIPSMPNALVVNMKEFLEKLYGLVEDEHPQVKMLVCKCFSALIERPKYLEDSIDSVVDFMLQRTQDEDLEVALSACEFWSSIAMTHICIDALEPKLKDVVKVLVSRMVYTEDDLINYNEELDTEDYTDREEDINPNMFFHESKIHGDSKSHGKSHSGTHEDERAENSEEEDEEEEEDSSGFESRAFISSPKWTVRQSAALALDSLASENVFGGDILEYLLPVLEECWSEGQEWDVLESGILAIGAVAEGCLNEMEKYIPEVLPFLIECTKHPKGLVRSMACWTISQYSMWVVNSNEPAETYFEPTLEAFLRCMLDRIKEVQKTACNGLGMLAEEAGKEMLPYMKEILETFRKAFAKYHAKNRSELYDTISILAESVGSHIAEEEYLNLLIPPLLEQWDKTSDHDRNLFTLFEALTSVLSFASSSLTDKVPVFFHRCMNLIKTNLVAMDEADRNDEEGPDKNFIVCPLDLLSGICEGLGEDFAELVADSDIDSVLYECMKNEYPNVRQSAFALAGDLAMYAPAVMKEHIDDYLKILVENVNPNWVFINVANNAIWAIGEISNKFRDLGERLITILNYDSSARSLLENSALTLGRLARINSDLFAEHLEDFASGICLALQGVTEHDEKREAFEGLVECVKKNPHAMVKAFPYLCAAIASWRPNRLPPELKAEFKEILFGFKNMTESEEKWNSYLSGFPKQLLEVLHEEYGLDIKEYDE